MFASEWRGKTRAIPSGWNALSLSHGKREQTEQMSFRFLNQSVFITMNKKKQQQRFKKSAKQFYDVFVAGLWKSAKHWRAIKVNKRQVAPSAFVPETLVTDYTLHWGKLFSSKSWTSTLSNYQIENKTCNLKISWILLKVTLNFTKGVGIYIPLTRRKVDKSPDRQVESIYSTAQMAPRALSTITDYLHRSGSKKILPYWFSMLLSYC